MRNNNPQFIKARFDSFCPETGKAILTGTECAYFPRERKAYHIDSKHADHVRGEEFNAAYGMADANW